MGIDVLVEFPLNPETAATDPVDFVKKILIEMMNMKFLAAGEDVSFGKRRKKEIVYCLKKWQRKMIFTVKIIEKIFRSWKKKSALPMSGKKF